MVKPIRRRRNALATAQAKGPQSCYVVSGERSEFELLKFEFAEPPKG